MTRPARPRGDRTTGGGVDDGDGGDGGERSLVIEGGPTLELARHPERPRERLRAWDAADVLAIEHLAGESSGLPAGRVGVVGDEWGAITCGLLASGVGDVVHIGDSFVAQQAARANLARNALPMSAVRFLDARTTPAGLLDALVVKVPKSLAAMDEWLRVVRPALPDSIEVVATAMTRHMHTSTLEVLGARIGATRPPQARRRARLALSRVGAPIDTSTRWPRRWQIATDESDAGPTVVGHVAAFAAERLDAGTAVLLEALARHRGPRPTTLVDLGCGTGVVGLVEAWRDEALELVFIDESFDAVASAEAGWRASFGSREARFVIGDRLETVAVGEPLGPGSVDRVVVNPPFHSGHALSDATAWDMFVQSRRVLRAGGDLWVVGNRHLGYHAKLKRILGNVEVVASTPAFVVLRSVRR